MFGTCRIPGEDIDSVVKDSSSSHIVIIRKGHYFKLKCYTDENKAKRILSEYELKLQLRKVVDMADSMLLF